MPITLDGTNGVSTPNTFAFKNRLINGNFGINQRGVSGTVTLSAGAYGHDRFKAGSSGCTYTFATSNNVTTLTITAGSLQQVVEGLNLETGTYALSWTGTAQGKIGAGSYGASGVTGSITGGTNTTVEFNTGTLSLAQLEKGSTATSFDYRPYGQELALCQRYYQTSYFGNAVGTATTSNQIQYTSASTFSYWSTNVFFQETMRAAPTVTSYSPVNGASGSLYSGSATVSAQTNAISPNGYQETVNGTSVTAGFNITFHYAASAEL